mmetsp:Transcript_23637/g.55103  ORF Transcript_23637/g.55103 Transcript_23637/m.55103 type:complete len:255 (-) Transcript_23637:128-892(-)
MPHLVEDLSIRLQHVRLHQELLLTLCLLLPELLQKGRIINEVLGLAMDGTISKHSPVGWLNKELRPPHGLNLLEHNSWIETILNEDSGDHRNSSLDKLLHVVDLVVDPVCILPCWPHVDSFLGLDDLTDVGLVATVQCTHHIVPHVEVDVVGCNPRWCELTALNEINLKDVRMQPEDLETHGHVDVEHATPAHCIWIARVVVVALVILRVLSVLRADGDGIMPFVANEANTDLGLPTNCRLHRLSRALALLDNQ